MKNKKPVVWTVLFCTAILLILSGGYTDCMRKAAGICWECIGLG